MRHSKHLERLVKIKTKHLQKEIKLRAKLSAIAINKAETTILERQEASNGKYDLLKEQTARFEAQYATKTEVKALIESISTLSKIVYIGLGIVLALQFIIPLLE